MYEAALAINSGIFKITLFLWHIMSTFEIVDFSKIICFKNPFHTLTGLFNLSTNNLCNSVGV